MIIIQFSGGLGNQISQYAMGKLLYSLVPKRTIKYDIDIYKKQVIHNGFELQRIFKNVVINEASVVDKFMVARIVPTVSIFHNYKIYNKCIGKIQNLFPQRNIYKQKYESGYPEDPVLLNTLYMNKYLVGTFHNYNYDNIIDNLRKDLVFPSISDKKNFDLLSDIRSTNSVSIHVRKGDYVNTDLDITGISFYKSAIDIIRNNISNPQFYIFSDDADYIKINFSFLNKDSYKIIDWNKGHSSYIDMQLMSECKHNIIANSTFSYWAAYLNTNENKLVIRPKMQTKDRITWTTKWIKDI